MGDILDGKSILQERQLKQQPLMECSEHNRNLVNLAQQDNNTKSRIGDLRTGKDNNRVSLIHRILRNKNMILIIWKEFQNISLPWVYLEQL